MLTPWSAAKVEAFDHLQALWRLDRALDAERLATSGGLQWKQVQGREYLIHHYIDPTAGKRRFDSKGVRSPETEAWASAFKTRREGCGAEGGRIAEQTRVQSAIAKAVRLGRAPAIVGETLRAVALSPLAGSVTLSGSLAMLAYEAQARANVDAAALPPPYGRPDLDLLLDEDVSLEAVAAVLRQVDTGFASAGFGGHRFSNGELSVDCFTRDDLLRVAEEFYEDDADRFIKLATESQVEGWIIDRAGAIAPTRVLPMPSFRALKRLRCGRDRLRADDEREFDARQATAVESLAASMDEPIEEDEDDLGFGAPTPGLRF